MLVRLLILIQGLMLSGCFVQSPRNSNSKSISAIVSKCSKASTNYACIILTDPLDSMGSNSLITGFNINGAMSSTPVLITTNSTLTYTCGKGTSNEMAGCYESHDNTSEDTTFLARPASSNWTFDGNSNGFLEVNTFYHTTKTLDFYNTFIQFLSANIDLPSPIFATNPIPNNLIDQLKYWQSTTSEMVTFKTFSNCGEADNASFQPGIYATCYGRKGSDSNASVALDSTVIHHETGHLITYLMMNLRNNGSGLGGVKTYMAYNAVDDSSTISEGLSDYISYVMTGKTIFGHWAFYNGGERPVSETSTLYTSNAIAETADGRISFPTYINYDQLTNTFNSEDSHASGKIISHHAVALSKLYKQNCNTDTTTANKYVLEGIAQTFAEFGDVSGKPFLTTDPYYILHYNENESYRYISALNPMNVRRYSQLLFKYSLQRLMHASCMNNSSSAQATLEKLWDDYGLLLFRKLNSDGNSYAAGHSGSGGTAITEASRLKSELIFKSNLQLADASKTSYFIVDSQESMLPILNRMIEAGIFTSVSSRIPSSLNYNNGNAKISPGEIVGISLNLYNNSNSTMGGVQVLGGDWFHTLSGTGSGGASVNKICRDLGDGFPGNTGNSALCFSGAGSGVGLYKSSNATSLGFNDYQTASKKAAYKLLAPSCLVEVKESSQTDWFTQDKLADQIRMEDKDCLIDGSRSDCFIRVVPGGDSAWFSRINPKTAWSETVTSTSGQNLGAIKSNATSSIVSDSNLIFIEVNPDTPPGTKFNCRFRARFTNCEDCWQEQGSGSGQYDDYLDYEFAGHVPYKIIDLQFTVTN